MDAPPSRRRSDRCRAIFCRGCRYDLTGLDSRACPECGQHFDPDLRETFFRSPRERSLSQWTAWACTLGCAGPVVHIGLVHLTLVGARLSLGRWPHRFGNDDPKNLAGLASALYWLAQVSIMLWPLSIAAAVMAGVVLAFRRRFLSIVLVVAVLSGSWALARWIAVMDPAKAVVWFMD
ncbi:MAG: hypothetical protein AB7O77_12200 [Phycisphaerales bacterium]